MRNCASIAGVLLAATLIPVKGSARPSGETSPQIKVENKRIKPTVLYQFSRSVGRGRLLKAQSGEDGQVQRTWRLTMKNGKVIARSLVKEVRTEPTPTIFLMGRDGYSQSRGSYLRSKVITMHASAYDPSPRTIGRRATGRTAMGIRAEYGTVAVDPRVIPLGTRVFVEGYGYAIAADKGSAIKGNRIDLCFGARSTALHFGRQSVKVHILKAR